MVGSRTIKTLVALLMAMTIGAVALIVMETAPSELPSERLAATMSGDDGPGRVVFQTDVPIQAIKWRNIVIHATGAEGREILARCHFIINPDGENPAVPTDLWASQSEGRHVYVAGFDYNSNSIGICLVGDFSRQGPSQRQYKALLAVVHKLQAACNIPADRVYLLNQLIRHESPGRAFPAADFADSLLKPQS